MDYNIGDYIMYSFNNDIFIITDLNYGTGAVEYIRLSDGGEFSTNMEMIKMYGRKLSHVEVLLYEL